MARFQPLAISVIATIFVSQLVFHCEGYRRGQARNSNGVPTDSDSDTQESPFAVISGWIDDSSNENEREPLMPWRHHVDFDELHPGQDQVAEETQQQPSSNFNPFVFNPDMQLPEMLPTPVPEVRTPRVAIPLPSFAADPDRELAHPFMNMQSLWNLLGGRNGAVSIPQPWYKGSNVCIKREEEDEIIEAEETGSSNVETEPTESPEENYEAMYIDNSMQGYPKDQPFISEANLNETESSPEWHMKLSYCRDQDTKRTCNMKLFGPKIHRTISVTYECCHGYELDAKKEKCERTRYENVAKTIEDLGGQEFLALVKNTGLLNKVKSENITIFVPSNDAVTTYLTSHAVESNDISFVVESEMDRRKRNIIFRRDNHPQGRNVRRHNFEHHNRHTSDEDESDEEPHDRERRGIIFNRGENNPQGRNVRRHGVDHHNRHSSEEDHSSGSHERRKRGIIFNRGSNNPQGRNVRRNGVDHHNRHTSEELEQQSSSSETHRRKRNIIFHRENNSQGRNVRRHNLGHHNRRHPSSVDEDEILWPQSEEDFDMNDIDWKQNALSRHEAHKRNLAYDHEDNQSRLQKDLLSHMIEGKITTDDFVDEKVIFSENSGSVLRMNTWNVGNEEVKTINCARLTSINHKCSNGMVHMIDRMIKPVSKSIADVITTDPELSLLKTLVASSGMMDMLSDRKQNLTFFAPTNAAINKLGHTILHKMQHGDPCLKRILRHHILPLTFCSCIIYKKGQVRNVDHEILDVVREADDKLYINGSQILVRDVMTTNGVVHVIDTVLMSENDQPISKALEKDGFTHFIDALRTAGLEDYIDELNNVTLFAPTNEAMEALGQEVLRQPSKLREILLYHIATPETKTCDLSNEQELPTRLHERKIRINMYSHFPIEFDTAVTAQCGKITKGNRMACNGVIHQVDRVLLPSELNIIETLKTQRDFSIFYRLLVQSGLLDKLKQPNSTATIFAPTDNAFYDLSKDDFKALLEDTENATRVVKNHIIDESLCCAGVAPNNWFMTKRVDCLNGAKIPMYRDASGQVMYGNAKVTTCDLTASNGIIHTVDKVLTASNDPNRGDLMESCLPGPLDTIRSATFIIRL